LIFACLLSLAILPESDYANATRLTLAVTLRAETDLGATESELLRREVERLFSPAGLCFRWLGEDLDSSVQVVVAKRPSEPVVYGCSRGLHDHRLGLAHPRTRQITLWTEQVARAATGIWDARKTPRPSASDLGRALGRTLAHELAHLLLPEPRHERTGLMRAAFKHHELTSESTLSLSFSPEEIGRLRTAVRERGLAGAQQASAGIKSQR